MSLKSIIASMLSIASVCSGAICSATYWWNLSLNSCYTASRTCCKVSVTGQYHGRTEVDFRKSGCNDADDSLFPTFIIEYDAGVVFLCLQS